MPSQLTDAIADRLQDLRDQPCHFEGVAVRLANSLDVLEANHNYLTGRKLLSRTWDWVSSRTTDLEASNRENLLTHQRAVLTYLNSLSSQQVLFNRSLEYITDHVLSVEEQVDLTLDRLAMQEQRLQAVSTGIYRDMAEYARTLRQFREEFQGELREVRLHLTAVSAELARLRDDVVLLELYVGRELYRKLPDDLRAICVIRDWIYTHKGVADEPDRARIRSAIKRSAAAAANQPYMVGNRVDAALGDLDADALLATTCAFTPPALDKVQTPRLRLVSYVALQSQLRLEGRWSAADAEGVRSAHIVAHPEVERWARGYDQILDFDGWVNAWIDDWCLCYAYEQWARHLPPLTAAHLPAPALGREALR